MESRVSFSGAWAWTSQQRCVQARHMQMSSKSEGFAEEQVELIASSLMAKGGWKDGSLWLT